MTSGYQATQFGRCVDEVNRMLKWRLSDEPIDDTTDEEERIRRTAPRCGVRSSWASPATSSPVVSASSSDTWSRTK